MKQIIFKHYDLQVKDSGVTLREQFELEKNVSKVRAILLTSNKDEQLYSRGAMKIEINGREIFPEGHECKILMVGLNAPMNNRYFEIQDVPVGNRILKVEYSDNSDSRSAFSSYRVRINLELETEEG